ncbi:MAG: L-rhamnose isomerase [Planctomycetales bacterium]|nr:L-rhamnose isomerase [Planctomycetales bacterium]
MSATAPHPAAATSDAAVEATFELARELYAAYGVDVDAALETLRGVAISLHCWQGDDVGGFENPDGELGSGLAVTGNFPGKARTPDELRADIDEALRLIPGSHRLNLHAFYAETGAQRVDRNELAVEHFARWIDWAKDAGLGMDFNPTCFAHPLADDGFTLSHRDEKVRQFWIEHCQASREIGAAMGAALGSPCVTNVWIPDGYKDQPVDRLAPRQRLADALDAVFAKPLPPEHNLDAVESKLFGIGSESYVVGSHEFYLGYAASRQKVLCLDAGHFHPTESIAEKISAVMLWVPELLLHVSRGVRWDSDHVVTYTDDLQLIGQEIVRGGFLGRTHIGLDFFDASINRIAAWVIGTRNTLRSVLAALLEPIDRLRELENNGDYTARLALLEQCKALPVGAVWDYHCLRSETPAGLAWLDEVHRYERDVLSQR